MVVNTWNVQVKANAFIHDPISFEADSAFAGRDWARFGAKYET